VFEGPLELMIVEIVIIGNYDNDNN
jgi:hypothetical protein